MRWMNPSYPWTADQGDGTFCNPVIDADYSDPDVIRAGEDFYMTASSFNCMPGLPILHSKDLINWSIIGHAVENLPHPRYAEVQPGCGIWAPSLRFHAGKFWIFFSMPDEGIYVTTTNHPAEKWSKPHLVEAGNGLIDPCPLWDDDGSAYLVHAYAHSRSGIKHMLRVRPMAADASRLLGEGEIVFHNPKRHPTIEGPKFLKRDGWYYISAAAGGVKSGWQVETLLEFAHEQPDEQAGIIVVGANFATLALTRKDSTNQLILRINGTHKFVQNRPSGAVELRVDVEDGGLCRFGFAADGAVVRACRF
jgi:beta-xylosidase